MKKSLVDKPILFLADVFPSEDGAQIYSSLKRRDERSPLSCGIKYWLSILVLVPLAAYNHFSISAELVIILSSFMMLSSVFLICYQTSNDLIHSGIVEELCVTPLEKYSIRSELKAYSLSLSITVPIFWLMGLGLFGILDFSASPFIAFIAFYSFQCIPKASDFGDEIAFRRNKELHHLLRVKSYRFDRIELKSIKSWMIFVLVLLAIGAIAMKFIAGF